MIPVGTQVRTTDGSQSFVVIADPTNPAYSASGNNYQLGAATGSVTVPVQAVVAGSSGNVQAGEVTMMAAAISGVDTVTNTLAFTNGMDAESDAALRARFQNWAPSLSRATPIAVQNAAAGVQQNVVTAIAEDVDTSGNPKPASFVLTVDDGTGTPSASLLANVTAAVEQVRPVGITYAVQPPVVVPAAITLTLVVTGNNKTALIGPVALAITSFVDTLPIGATLPYSRLATLAYGVDPSIVNVTSLTVNGGTTDLAPPWNGVVKAASVTVD